LEYLSGTIQISQQPCFWIVSSSAPYLLNKHEWNDQTLELRIEMITAPGSNLPKVPTSGGPQKITRIGRKAVVVVSAEERERKTKRRGTLAEFFASSPLRASRLKVKRSKDKLRSADS
jgi:hypothetical protein